MFNLGYLFNNNIVNEIVILGRGTSKEQFFDKRNNFLNIKT